MDADLLRGLLPGGSGLRVTHVDFAPDAVTVELAVSTTAADCPGCGRPSVDIHSRYLRRVRDLPCCGRVLTLVITARKFRCGNPACARSVFCERLPELTPAHARTTGPLGESHRAIGLALGGEAGARLARRLAMPTSPDTLLRRVQSAPVAEGPPPRYVGVDDWAYRKGQNYGTIVIDLERHRVLDILPGRDGEALKAWLREHPGVAVISRDRWPAFAQAAAEAAPQAEQVADRWHLLKNLRESVERLLERRYGVVREAVGMAQPSSESTGLPPVSPTGPPAAAPSAEPTPAPAADATGPPTAAPANQSVPRSARQEARRAKRQRRRETYEHVRRLAREGHSIDCIARRTGLGPQAVRRYVHSERCPDGQPGRDRPTTVDRFSREIDRHLQTGRANAAAIHRALAARGCPASYYAVRRFVARRRKVLGRPQGRARATATPGPRRLSVRRLTFELFRRAEGRKPDEQARVTALHQVEGLREALALTDQFVAMIRKQLALPLTDWLPEAEQSACPELRGFAERIRQDQAAVAAALTEPWSNGPVEGAVNRLKMLKRQMFGRAGLPLLRARVRQAAS